MSSAITAAVVAVGSVVSAKKSAKKGEKAQKAANELQKKINKLKNQQAMRDYMRNFRQAQANTIVSAVAAGVGLDSSAMRGTMSSHISQATLVQRESEQMSEWGEAMSTQNLKASSAFNRSAQWSQISQFAASFISFGGGKGSSSSGGKSGGGKS